MNGLILTLTGAVLIVSGFFFGHEFGYVEGQQYQKYVNNEKLQSCNKIIAGSLYANPTH